MHILNLVVCKNKKKSHGKSSPGRGTLLNQHSDLPPLLGFLSGRAHSGKKSVPTKFASPPHPPEWNGRPLKHNYPFVLWCHFATVVRSRVCLFLGIVDVTISYNYHTTKSKTMYGSNLASLTDTVASLYTKEKVNIASEKVSQTKSCCYDNKWFWYEFDIDFPKKRLVGNIN